MKYAQHCDKLKKEMEKSQRTVKILDMPVEDSLIGGKIENTNTARENIKKTLKTSWTFLLISLSGAQSILTWNQYMTAVHRSV